MILSPKNPEVLVSSGTADEQVVETYKEDLASPCGLVKFQAVWSSLNGQLSVVVYPVESTHYTQPPLFPLTAPGGSQQLIASREGTDIYLQGETVDQRTLKIKYDGYAEPIKKEDSDHRDQEVLSYCWAKKHNALQQYLHEFHTQWKDNGKLIKSPQA